MCGPRSLSVVRAAYSYILPITYFEGVLPCLFSFGLGLGNAYAGGFRSIHNTRIDSLR